MKKQAKQSVSTLAKRKHNEPPHPPVGADQAVTIVNKFILMNYPLGLLSGPATRLSIHDADVWVVPLMLTSTGLGVVGLVGTAAVDARTGEMVGSSPAAEVVSSIRRLREEKSDDIQAAFLRAGT